VELGFEVRRQKLARLRSSYSPYPSIDVDAGFKAGLVAQVIGDVGMPSARSMDSRALENGSLYLVGFQMTFVLKF
jgi:hypothetical protein